MGSVSTRSKYHVERRLEGIANEAGGVSLRRYNRKYLPGGLFFARCGRKAGGLWYSVSSSVA